MTERVPTFDASDHALRAAVTRGAESIDRDLNRDTAPVSRAELRRALERAAERKVAASEKAKGFGALLEGAAAVALKALARELSR